jgi:hypothetical protein
MEALSGTMNLRAIAAAAVSVALCTFTVLAEWRPDAIVADIGMPLLRKVMPSRNPVVTSDRASHAASFPVFPVQRNWYFTLR